MAELITANIEKVVVPVSALKVEFASPDLKFKNRAAADRAMRIILPDGRKLATSNKFWITLSQSVGVSRNIFDLFDYKEVFDRISTLRKDNIRLAFETNDRVDDGTGNMVHGKALTITNPSRPIMHPDDANRLIEKYGGIKPCYKDGVVGVSFDAPFPMNFQVVGKQDSDFTTRFYMTMPIDGYGQPATYLELLRKVCTNGAVAMSKAFRTTFSLGKDDVNIAAVLDRAIDAFNNEEGYHAFKERMEVGAKSWGSLYDMMTLSKSIQTGATAENMGIKERCEILKKLDTVCGNPMYTYGMLNNNEYSQRVTKTMPVKITMYDLINFASEVATHHFNTLHGRNKLNAWIGDTITNEYNLEGSCESYGDFSDFFLKSAISTDNSRRKDAAQ